MRDPFVTQKGARKLWQKEEKLLQKQKRLLVKAHVSLLESLQERAQLENLLRASNDCP